MTRTLDLNCDMGESFGAYKIGEDAAMLEVVTTANIACGFHAGDPIVIQRTIRNAKRNGIAIGAHPSFADFYGFGRRRITGERPEDLEAQLIYQIAAVRGMAAAEDHAMTHVKTHGALGNMAAEDANLAKTCVRAVMAVDPQLCFVALPYSETEKAAEKAGLPVVREVFADRTYTDQGQLTPRSEPGAVILDIQQSVDQVMEMVVNRFIPTVGGKKLAVEPDTLCVHGDTPNAIQMAVRLRKELTGAGLSIKSFAQSRLQRPGADETSL